MVAFWRVIYVLLASFFRQNWHGRLTARLVEASPFWLNRCRRGRQKRHDGRLPKSRISDLRSLSWADHTHGKSQLQQSQQFKPKNMIAVGFLIMPTSSRVHYRNVSRDHLQLSFIQLVCHNCLIVRHALCFNIHDLLKLRLYFM